MSQKLDQTQMQAYLEPLVNRIPLLLPIFQQRLENAIGVDTLPPIEFTLHGVDLGMARGYDRIQGIMLIPYPGKKTSTGVETFGLQRHDTKADIEEELAEIALMCYLKLERSVETHFEHFVDIKKIIEQAFR